MARSRELRVEIVGDTKSFNRATDSAGRSVGDLDDKTSRFKATAADAFKTAGVAAAGFAVVGLTAAVKAAIDAEKSQARLDAQLKAVGSTFRTNSDVVQDVIQKHSLLAAIDDEDLQDAFGNLVRASGNVEKSLKLVGLTADIARGRHMEVADAATLVGKVAGGNVGILSRYGFVMKEGATATEALGILQQRFAGQAAAYGKTTEGSYQRVRVVLENLGEQIGSALLPHLTKAANALSRFLNQMQRGRGEGGEFRRSLEEIWPVIRDIVIWTAKGIRAIQFLVGGFGDAARAIIRLWTNIWDKPKKALGDFLASIGRGVTKLLKLGGIVPGLGDKFDTAARKTAKWAENMDRMGEEARQGSGRIERLRGELDSLKSKTVKLKVSLEIATSDFSLEPLGDGWGIEGAIRKQAGADIKSGKINPFGFISGGLGGGGNLMGADPAGAIYAAIGARFGLGVSSGLRPGAITSSGNPSLHGIGRALDISGSASGMLAFGRFLASAFGSRLKELIHTPMGFSIKNGARVAPYAQADHYDHVHVGFQRGGIVPGTGSGDKVTVGARVEPGEGLFVLNRNATSVLQKLNEMVPRFAKGGWSRTPINIAADAARKAGFRGRDLVNMVAIAGRESTYNPRAANYTYPDHSIGLWQINQLAHKGRYGSDSALMNPYTNAKAAYALFKGGGYGPWVGVGYGNASSYLDDARAAVLATKGGGTAAGRKGKGGGGPQKPRPRLGAVSTYETDLAQADRLLDRAGDIDPTNKRDVQAVGGKLLLLGFRKAAIRRRLKKIRRDLRKKLSPATRRRLLDEQASLIGELGGIESESRGLHESMVPEAGEESTAAEDQAAAAKELAEQIKALKESIDEQNRITSSTAAIGLREAQRALADMISGEIGGLVGQRNRSPGDGVTAARY